jgi:hypothetical protein
MNFKEKSLVASRGARLSKWLFGLGVVVAAAAAHAQLSLSMPYGSAGYGTDSISANGVNCSNAINGSAQFETGVLATQDRPTNQTVSTNNSSNDMRTGLYARVVVPINPPKSRIDCSRLYEITLQRQQLELQALREQLQEERKQRNPDLSEFSLSQIDQPLKKVE